MSKNNVFIVIEQTSHCKIALAL